MEVMNFDASFVFWTVGIICICTTAVNLITKHFFSRRASNKETTDDFNDCESPSCMRCRQRASTLMKARTKLTYFTMTENTDDTELKSLMSDIEKCYNGDIDSSNNQRPCVFQLTALPSQPFFDVKDTAFTTLQKLTQKWEDIHREFGVLYEEFAGGALNHWRVNETPSGRWAICHLVDQGRPTQALDLCPSTWSLIRSCPDIMLNCVFGNVAFSVVFPGTNISHHYGATNVRLRGHLGLRGADWCRLEVGGERRGWEAGRLLLFDDSFRHAVVTSEKANPAGGDGGRGEDVRAVLLFDLWHPDLSREVRQMLSYAFSSDP